jgi:hypothetical protein
MSFEDERPFDPPVTRPGSRLMAGVGPSPITRVRMLAREYSEAAIHALVAIMENPLVDDHARISAARALLDYAHGRTALTTSATDALRQIDGIVHRRKQEPARESAG